MVSFSSVRALGSLVGLAGGMQWAWSKHGVTLLNFEGGCIPCMVFEIREQLYHTTQQIGAHHTNNGLYHLKC